MERVRPIDELKARMKDGYKAEVLFNYRTSNYEVPTWKRTKDGFDDKKLLKFPKESADIKALIKIVYGKLKST